MVLLDDRRRHVDANAAYVSLLGYSRRELVGRPLYSIVVGGPAVSPTEWRDLVTAGRLTGEAKLTTATGGLVAVQYAATSERVTGRYLVLVVALSTSRWGRHFRRPTQATGPRTGLSSREREIVRLVSHGNTGPEIADELHISHETVRKHVSNAMTKLDARSRAHLVAKALGEGAALAEPANVGDQES